MIKDRPRRSLGWNPDKKPGCKLSAMFRLKQALSSSVIGTVLKGCSLRPRKLDVHNIYEKITKVTCTRLIHSTGACKIKSDKTSSIEGICKDIIFPSQEDKALTVHEWKEKLNEIRTDEKILQVLENQRAMQHIQGTVHVIAGTICKNNQFTDGMASLVQYSRKHLESSQHFVLLQLYLSLLGRLGFKENQELIYELFDEYLALCAELKLPPQPYHKHVVEGLCATERWRDCLDILTKKDSCNSLVDMFSPLIIAAFSEEEYNIALKILSLYANSAHRRGGYAPPPDFFKRVLQLVQKLHRQRDKDNSSDRQAVKQSEMIVQGLLRKMHSHLWCLPESCLEEMKDWFEEHQPNETSHPFWKGKWIGTIVSIDITRMSQCPNCNQLIHRHPTYHKEYKELLPGVLTKIENLKSSNFSTDFCKFLDSIGPVDLVVDYLNIYGWGRPKVSMTELLHENYGFKNILFIVGVQMSIPIISRRIKVYQFQSRPKSEEDDLCVVYAAIKKRCPFLSKDRYVTHGDLEYSANGRLFHKWRFEHQLIYDDTQGPGYKIRPLCKVQPKPLMHAAHCHIPGISYAGVTSDDDMFPIKWLCLRKVDESGTSLE